MPTQLRRISESSIAFKIILSRQTSRPPISFEPSEAVILSLSIAKAATNQPMLSIEIRLVGLRFLISSEVSNGGIAFKK